MSSQSSDLTSVNDDNMDQAITIKTEIIDEPEHIIFQINQDVKNEPGISEYCTANIKNEPNFNEQSLPNHENVKYYEVPLENKPGVSNLEQAPSIIAQNSKQSEDCHGEKNITDLEQILTNITQNIEKEQEDALEQEQHRTKESLKQHQIVIKLEPVFPDDIENTDIQPQSEPITDIIEDENMKLKIEHNIQVSTEKYTVMKQEPVDNMISTIKEELEQHHEEMESELILRNINAVYSDDIDNDDGLIDPKPEENVKIGRIANKNKTSNAQSLLSTGISTGKKTSVGKTNMCKYDVCHEPMKTYKGPKHHKATQEQPFMCQYCERGFMSKYSLDRHIRANTKEHGLSFVNTNDDNKDSLDEHKSMNAEWSCPTCEETFKFKCQMMTHYRRFHEGKQTPLEKPNDCIPEVEDKPHEATCKCTVCCKPMKSSKCSKRHMAGHSGERNFMCHHCDRDFVSKYSLERHNRIRHSDEKEYICYVCNTKFNNKDSLEEHKLIHADEWPHPCPKCDKKYKIKSQMKAHYRTIHEGIKRKQVAKSSSKTADKVMCKCDVCGKLMSSAKGLKKHMVFHSADRLFVCNYCERDFVSKYSLERHIRIHTDEKKYLCYVCNTNFDTKDSLDEHKAIHADEWPHPCPMCDKKYKIKGQMKAHHRRVHEGIKPPDKPNDCPICKKTIYTEKSFISHMQKHKGVAPTCNQCGKQFTKNASLHVHMRSHTGETPFACNICDRKLKTKSHLKMHLRTHTGERKHKCDVCGKCFNEKFHLNGHKLIHEGKTFECKPCGKKFGWKASYINHQKIHHPEDYSEFTCHHCDKSFGLKSYLRQHIIYVCYPSVMNKKVPVRKRNRKVIYKDWDEDSD